MYAQANVRTGVQMLIVPEMELCVLSKYNKYRYTKLSEFIRKIKVNRNSFKGYWLMVPNLPEV